MRDNTQKVYSEESSIGRQFIRFAGLTLFSYLKHKWKSTDLNKLYDAKV